MKTWVFFIAFIIFSFSSFCQTTEINNRDDYLKKSKKQRTVAWLMLGGGVALTGVGINISATNSIDEALGSSQKNSAGPVLAVIGAASAIGSIPFFISASRNKKIAASLSASVQSIPGLYAAKTITVAQPAITLSIPF